MPPAAGQVEVEQDRVGPAVGHLRQEPLAVRGGSHVMAALAEHAQQRLPARAPSRRRRGCGACSFPRCNGHYGVNLTVITSPSAIG